MKLGPTVAWIISELDKPVTSAEIREYVRKHGGNAKYFYPIDHIKGWVGAGHIKDHGTNPRKYSLTAKGRKHLESCMDKVIDVAIIELPNPMKAKTEAPAVKLDSPTAVSAVESIAAIVEENQRLYGIIQSLHRQLGEVLDHGRGEE